MNQEMQKTNQITEGVIWKQLLIFFFPIVFGTFFQQLYNTVDTVIVGHFVGKEALASVGGSASQITNMIVGFFTGLSSGASVMVAQFFGAKDERSVRQNLHTAYTFSIMISVIITVLGILLTPAMLRWMKTPEELFHSSSIYLRIYFSGILFTFIYNVGSSILRAIGDSRRPLYYLIVCCIINIVLDLLLVLQFKMGVVGVALATVFSQLISAILITRRLIVSDGILKLIPQEMRIHRPALKSQLSIGIPAGLQSCTYSITNIIIQVALNNFGTDTIAAWSVYGKLDALYWMIGGAFGISITTFVGQNYGARKYDRIRKSTRVCLEQYLVFALFMTGFFIVFRTPLFHIFTTDKNVVLIGAEMVFLIAPWYSTYAFIEVFSSALRGMGDVIIPTLLTLCGVCLLRIGWVLGALKINPTIEAIIFSYPVTWASTAILFIVYYLFRIRKLGQPKTK